MRPHYGARFRILHSCADQRMNSALARMDLTAAQGHLVGFIARAKDPPCARDLEEFFQLSHPTVSGLLSRLEKKEFLEFRPDPHDRRCKRIFLLPKGVQCHERIIQTIQEMEQTIVEGFSPEEEAAFSRLLDRAICNLGGSVSCRPIKEEPDK